MNISGSEIKMACWSEEYKWCCFHGDEDGYGEFLSDTLPAGYFTIPKNDFDEYRRNKRIYFRNFNEQA